jgi:microcystin-dependent protein
MSDPYIGEIRMFGGNFAPNGWAFCNGQAMAISQNSTLFNLIGTTYGGDGVNTFNLPDLRGRLPIHQDNTFVMGQLAGTETVTLISNQIPQHTHGVAVLTNAGASSPSNAVYGGNTADPIYTASAPSVAMNAGVVGMGGGSLPHSNIMPYCVINFIISLFGIYPTQS